MKISSGKLNVFYRLIRNQLSGALLFILLFFHAISLEGQSKEFSTDQYVSARFSQITINEGLSQNLITGPIQASCP